jgi:hypothetical protein
MSKVLTDQIEKRTGGTAIDLPATGKWSPTTQLDTTGTADTTTFLRGDGSWSAIVAGDITTANNFFQNWNTIDVNTTSTFATTINAAIIGPISVTGSYVWSVNGTLNII